MPVALVQSPLVSYCLAPAGRCAGLLLHTPHSPGLWVSDIFGNASVEGNPHDGQGSLGVSLTKVCRVARIQLIYTFDLEHLCSFWLCERDEASIGLSDGWVAIHGQVSVIRTLAI